jgi:hypothetical protein
MLYRALLLAVLVTLARGANHFTELLEGMRWTVAD